MRPGARGHTRAHTRIHEHAHRTMAPPGTYARTHTYVSTHQTRIQNHGSSGEGIWVVKLKAGAYCGRFGDRLCGDDELLELIEVGIHTPAHTHTHTHTYTQVQ